MTTSPEAAPFEEEHTKETYMKEANQWAMFLHLSQLAGFFVVPLAGLIVPIIIWQLKKGELPKIDLHGKMVTNWIISEIIYVVALFLIGVGISFFFPPILFCIVPMIVAIALVGGLVYPIVGGVKANKGELWTYPLTIRFLK